MPHSGALWMAAGLLWILDASVNISMEPFRAFVADLLPEQQRTVGFAMQSVFIGAGAVIASKLPGWLRDYGGVSAETGAGQADPADGARGVHRRRGRVLPRGAVDGFHDQRVPAGARTSRNTK